MILLFGGGGQLGQEIAQQAVRSNVPLMALSRRDADIADADKVMQVIKDHGPHVVLNAAGYTNVDGAESDREAAFLTNACGAGNLAMACHAAGVPLVHFSTDYVFDGAKRGAYVEDDPVAPLSDYGRSKLAGEDIIRATHPMHLILRTAWLYGVFGKNFLKTMMRLATERDEIRVVADQHGNPTSTGQIAAAVFSVLPRLLERNCPWGTYHLAARGTASWFSFAENIVAVQSKYTGKRPAVVPIATGDYPAVAKRPPNSTLDCSLFVKSFEVDIDPWKSECERVVYDLLR
jgi:dTDP-4-dehydrorhamnose reductase